MHLKAHVLTKMQVYSIYKIMQHILIYVLRQGTTSHDSYSEDMYRKLLESYQQLDQEMSSVAVEWLECEKRIDNYVDEQVGHEHCVVFVHCDLLCVFPINICDLAS